MTKKFEAQVGLSLEGVESSRSLIISGAWVLDSERLSARELLSSEFQKAFFTKLSFETSALNQWDTALLILVRDVLRWSEEHSVDCALSGLPEGVLNLINLSRAVPEQKKTAAGKEPDFLSKVGNDSVRVYQGIERYVDFLGQLVIGIFTLMRGKAQLRWKDFLYLLHSTGPSALLIVSLLSFLTGLIIAFIGVIQLQKFAADIYVADLVGLAMTRELGAVMVGVIMSGRTGAAFAAQIGSMQVNEEVDALTSFGISPMQFLVVPRVIVLVLMMPLLCACANIVGILGGMVVAVAISEVSVIQYFNQAELAVGLNDLFAGIVKSAVFGLIIAVAGCYRGLNCGRDATAVGQATTSAVVTSITWIVIADAIFAVAFHMLGI
ncbi:MAG: MlaE family ABC transporter permease [Lentimonas sp.]